VKFAFTYAYGTLRLNHDLGVVSAFADIRNIKGEIDATPIISAIALYAISFFSIFMFFLRQKHMWMMLIILPEEQNCSPKEQTPFRLCELLLRYGYIQPA
jgi:hypothetical protein